MNYENGNKNIFGLSVVLELKVKKSGPILVTKYVHLKSKLSKYGNYKSWSPFLLYFSMKKKHSERFRQFLTNDFENQNCAVFNLQF
jgi:hypothetical protein